MQREVEIKQDAEGCVLTLRQRYAEDSPWYQATRRYDDAEDAADIAHAFMLSTNQYEFEREESLVLELIQG